MSDFKNLTIIIPSSGRPDKQVTLNQLPPVLLKQTYLAVPIKEVKDYKQWDGTCKVFGVPSSVKGISKTRELFLSSDAWTRYMLMLDDDMTFAYRFNMSKPALEAIQPRSVQIEQLVKFWLNLCQCGFVHAGLSARQGNNNSTEEVTECSRMYNAYMYDLKVLHTLPIKLGRLPVMEDFDLTLQLLKLGYPNAMINRWCWNQSGSNAKGGCSQYRTSKMQHDAAHKLAKLHAPYVKVVTKESKNWQGMETRTDVRVQWKKAYQDAPVKHGPIG